MRQSLHYLGHQSLQALKQVEASEILCIFTYLI